MDEFSRESFEQNSKESEHHDEEDFRYPKSVVVGVIVLSVLVVVLSMRQLKDRLAIDFPDLGNGELALEQSQSLLDQEDEQLKQQDSDGDGLTDFEELRVYGTSPFIADTDSDGISDPAEIEDGTDPNCPEGQNCFTPLLQESTKVTFQGGDQAELEAISSNPAEIRRLLIEGGADPRVVNSIDDQTLQILAQEAITSFNQPAAVNAEEELKSLTPDQLRQILIANGISETELAEFTDDELQALFNQVILETQQQVQQEVR